jgi:hypothetical protein
VGRSGPSPRQLATHTGGDGTFDALDLVHRPRLRGGSVTDARHGRAVLVHAPRVAPGPNSIRRRVDFMIVGSVER